MISGLLSVADASAYLSIKKSTLYSKLSDIPHYKIGRLIRFKKEEIDSWLEGTKVIPVNPEWEAKKILRRPREGRNEKIEKIVRKNIDQVKAQEYNFCQGRPGKVKDLGKGESDV